MDVLRRQAMANNIFVQGPTQEDFERAARQRAHGVAPDFIETPWGRFVKVWHDGPLGEEKWGYDFLPRDSH
jgi:hypothetical protein